VPSETLLSASFAKLAAMYIDRETPVREFIQSKTAQGVGGLSPKGKLVAERGRHGPGAENASRKVAKSDSGGRRAGAYSNDVVRAAAGSESLPLRPMPRVANEGV